jgi:DNA-directed RNA polymerase beta subunit/intein/homing endonuclease
MSTENNSQMEKMTTNNKKNLSNGKYAPINENDILESKKKVNDNLLSIDDIFEFMDLYFNRRYVMYSHAKNSFDKFIEDDIKNFLSKSDNTFFEKITKDRGIKYKFEFTNIAIRPPVMGSDGQFMFPSDARENNLTYASKLVATVTQIQEISDIYTKEIISHKIIGNPENNVPIATIPILVRSKYCSLNLKKDYDGNECEYDPGCYFIVNGAEKVVISQERMCENKPLVFVKKDSNSQIYVVQVNSRSPTVNGLMQVMTINLKNNGVITLRVPILTEFPILLLFRALGVESDKDIIDYIVHDKNDSDMLNMVIKAIRMSMDEKGNVIKTQSEAINYLASKIRVLRKYSETDKDIRQKQKRIHLEHLLDNNFLPHVTGGRTAKVFYIGYMINRLLNCALGRNFPDDRDSYLNKRVDLVGNLMDELFRQFFRKMLNECNKYFKKRNTNDEEPINIINQIRPNTIEQGLKAALLTGAWGKKKGVAQVLQRLTYLQAIEFFRRIDSPSNDAASSKLTHPRHLHATQNANLCCVTGDTEILLSDGITKKKIRDFTNADIIVTVNPETLEEEQSQIHSFFKKDPTNIIKITTMSGRILKCTTDHPILVNTIRGNCWKRAGELQINDNIIIKHLNIVEEYLEYKRNIIKSNNENIMIFNEFLKKYYLCDDKSLNSITKIENIANESVYDFTTTSNNHSFIANDIIVHNCVETPEHAKVGLVKHLTIIGSVTVPTLSQMHVIQKIIMGKLIHLNDIDPTQLIKFTKVFLNGDWIGVCDKAMALYYELKQMKYNGTIEATTSIVYDDETNEIKLYCDGGRLYRPTIRVENNEPLLTKKHIDMISPNKTKSETMITSWDEFMQRNPGVIEYIDSDEQAYSMISPSVETLWNMKIKEDASRVKAATSKNIDKINRYGEMTFLKYSHCEFHPSLLLGLIATNIPFLNHNQGPRNIFQYAQGRQAMCIYISNYRYRLDTSYILYHPHKPLVNTRTSKFMYNDILSPGENAVVAIGCYTGYNQEDSIVFNKSAIERGLFRSTSYNKYVSIIQKNQSTSQDDIFMKPDPTKVSGMKHGSYDKLNEKGYVPEETTVVNGDFLIGKVSPIQPTANSNKMFKDNSESYKQHVPGVVDKVYSDIYNVEGYEMKKMRVRSERIPAIGDKYCIPIDLFEVLTDQGWKHLDEITLENKVATLVDGKQLVYENPTGIYKFNYTGNMYKVRSQLVDIDVTMDHTMYIKKRDHLKFELIPAKDIVGKRYSFKKNCESFGNDDIKTINIDGNDVSYDAFLELLGMFIADGCMKSKNTITIADEKERKIIHIQNVCERLKIDVKFCKNPDSHLNTLGLGLGCGHIIKSETLSQLFRPLNVGAINKYLPEYVWSLNMKQSRVLLESLISCDGSHNQVGSVYYYTSSKLLADDVMRLAIHAGWSGSIKVLREEGTSYGTKKDGSVGVLNADTLCIGIVKTENEPTINHGHCHEQNGHCESIYQYDGLVGCLEVPSHVFMIRQNNKNVWVGNCSRHG